MTDDPIPWQTEPLGPPFLSDDDRDLLAIAAYVEGAIGSFTGWDTLDEDEQERWKRIAVAVVNRWAELAA